MSNLDLSGLAPLDFASLPYMQAHLDFRENRTDQNARISEALISALRELRPTSGSFKIASVGAGTGILDFPIISALLADGPIDFLAIEPNTHELDDLKRRFAAIDSDAFQLDTHCGLIEDYTGDGRFDAVIGVHISYYSADIAPLIQGSLNLRETDGKVLFVVSKDMPGNQLFVDTTEALHGYRPPLDRGFADILDGMNIPYQSETITARIDLDAYLADPRSAKNRLLLDFYLHASTEGLPDQTLDSYIDILTSEAKLVDGVQTLAHNATLFTF